MNKITLGIFLVFSVLACIEARPPFLADGARTLKPIVKRKSDDFNDSVDKCQEFNEQISSSNLPEETKKIQLDFLSKVCDFYLQNDEKNNEKRNN